MRCIFHQIAGRHELPNPHKHSRVIAVTLVAVLMLSLALPVSAAILPQNSPKQEVVYINLNGDGSVRDISVVNSFELSEAGEITDHGAYTSLRNMTTNDAIAYEHETVRIRTRAGKLYYEGALKSRVAPWDVSIRYTLDGAEYAAEALAGKSGRLQITLTVRQSADCDPTFFEHYGLQAVITLDTKLCKNIVADGATQANVGADRQLSYTILPGKGKVITVTADVTDFEMDGVTLNALPLHMDVEVDTENNESFNEQITELEDGVTELDDGAAELRDGADELRGGADELRDGAVELRDGAIELTDGTKKALDGTQELSDGAGSLLVGANRLGSGASELSSGLSTLSGKTAELTDGAYRVFTQLCKQAETQINAALPNGMPSISLTPESYVSILESLLRQLYNAACAQAAVALGANAEQSAIEAAATAALAADPAYQAILTIKAQLDSYASFYNGLLQYTSGVSTAASGAASLASGSSELINGTGKLCRGASELNSGVLELHNGAAELKDGTVTLLDGANTLCDGVDELYDGTVELTDGTGEFRDKTANLDTDVKEEVNDAIHDALGGDFDVVSFVSAENENVESVQFVIKTDGIDGAEKATIETISAEPPTFWEKLLALFGSR